MAERNVDALLVRWYERSAGAPDVVDRWLEAAREHLPEARPERFGDTEPLRGRFGRDGAEGLARAYAAADTFLSLQGTPPVHHASLAATGGARRGPTATGGARRGPTAAGGARRGPTIVHSMSVEAEPSDERVRRFALALTHPGTIYVSLSVERGLRLDRRTLWGPAAEPGEPYLAAHGDWLGLPPQPPVWCWFGPVYQRFVPHPEYRGGPWVRESLRARLDEAEPSRRRARRLPRGLHRSAFRLIRDYYAR